AEVEDRLFVAIAISQLGWAAGPGSVIEIGLTPGHSLIAVVIQIFPNGAFGNEDRDRWRARDGNTQISRSLQFAVVCGEAHSVCAGSRKCKAGGESVVVRDLHLTGSA